MSWTYSTSAYILYPAFTCHWTIFCTSLTCKIFSCIYYIQNGIGSVINDVHSNLTTIVNVFEIWVNLALWILKNNYLNNEKIKQLWFRIFIFFTMKFNELYFSFQVSKILFLCVACSRNNNLDVKGKNNYFKLLKITPTTNDL